MGNSQDIIMDGEKNSSKATKRKAFIQGASQGNLQQVKDNFSTEIDINKQYQLEQTLLYYACFKGYADIVEFLLQRGADTLICEVNGNFPIHIACIKGQTKVVEKLMLHGANTNLFNKKNRPPLFFAVYADQLQITSLLLQNGGTINTRTKEGLSYLYLACQHGNFKMVELLVNNGALVNVTSNKGAINNSPMHAAANKGYYKIVSYLIDHGAHLTMEGEYVSPLLTAVINKHLATIDILLDAGADVNFVDTKVNQSSLHVAASKNRSDIMATLINHGAHVDIADKNGLTPLHLASVYGCIEAAKILLQHEADASITSKKGNTAVKIAKTDEMKVLLGGSGSLVQPSAPPMPELEEDINTAAPHNWQELPEKGGLLKQLEEKEQELDVIKQRCTEVESDIEDLKKRISEGQKNNYSIMSHQIQDHLECPICLEVPFTPTKVFQCEQGHIFCELCYSKGLTFCPECRVDLDPNNLIRNRRLEDVIKGLNTSHCD